MGAPTGWCCVRRSGLSGRPAADGGASGRKQGEKGGEGKKAGFQAPNDRHVLLILRGLGDFVPSFFETKSSLGETDWGARKGGKDAWRGRGRKAEKRVVGEAREWVRQEGREARCGVAGRRLKACQGGAIKPARGGRRAGGEHGVSVAVDQSEGRRARGGRGAPEAGIAWLAWGRGQLSEEVHAREQVRDLSRL